MKTEATGAGCARSRWPEASMLEAPSVDEKMVLVVRALLNMSGGREKRYVRPEE